MSEPVSANKSPAPKVRGYDDAGASITKRSLKGFTATSGAPTEDIDRSNLTLRQRSRMLYMSAPVATSAINTSRTKIVGSGLTLKSSIDPDMLGITKEAAKEWQRHVEAEFRLWAGKKQFCDATGMNDFDGLQQLALKSWLMSGDVFAVLKHDKGTRNNPYGLRVHIVEADRVRTPLSYVGGKAITSMTEGVNPNNNNDIHDGVEVDKSGRAIAYHICNCYPFQYTGEEEKWTRVEIYGTRTGLPNILHVTESERPDQYRGVPYLAQTIETMLQMRRYTESEITAAIIQSFHTAWVETEADTSEMPFNEVGSGDIDGEPTASSHEDNISQSENEYEMGPGTINVLAPGEKVQFGNPNIPTAGFETFIKTLCRLLGASLEIPYDVLIKEFNSSYSASRGALLEAWEAFRMRRKWFVNSFCQPIYEVWLSEAVALGRVKAPGFFTDPLIRAAWCGAKWIGPVQGSLDPKKETEAAILQIENGLKTHEQVTLEQGGGDWEANVTQLGYESDALDAAGVTKKATPAPAQTPQDGQDDQADDNTDNEEGDDNEQT